jgi:hypothetical protein
MNIFSISTIYLLSEKTKIGSKSWILAELHRFSKNRKTCGSKSIFFPKQEKNKFNFVKKDFAAKILKYTRKVENLKLYKWLI